MLGEVWNAFCCCKQNSKAPCECNIPQHKFGPGFRRSQHFIHIIFPRKENFFELGNKANPPRLSLIFSAEAVPYSQTSNPVYNTVRNEIRRIDNFEEKEIRRKGKNINWIVEYTHPGITIKATGIKRDSSTNFFIFLPPLNLPGKASRICKCWFDDVVSSLACHIASQHIASHVLLLTRLYRSFTSSHVSQTLTTPIWLLAHLLPQLPDL